MWLWHVSNKPQATCFEIAFLRKMKSNVTSVIVVSIDKFFFCWILTIILTVNKWIANLIANATKYMMEQKDERYLLTIYSFDNSMIHS